MKNLLNFELFERELYEGLPQFKFNERPKSKNILDGATHLRKLTKKSKLNFGKWGQLQISNLIDNDEVQYLRWVYFNCSNIDFMDDILLAIGIPAIVRVPKPGKDPELGKTLDKAIQKVYGTSSAINFELDQHKKMQVIKKMELDNTNKPTADTDVSYTPLKFGKKDGGWAAGRSTRGTRGQNF